MREIALAILVGAVLIAWSGRYEVGGEAGTAVVVDNFSGRTWFCDFGGCSRVRNR